MTKETMIYTIKDTETNKTFQWTLTEVLAEINRDRSGDWQDYDQTDWREGWNFWVEEEGYLTMIKD
jgi:hypothetical protein